MTLHQQKQIADSFSDKFEEFDLNLKLPIDQFLIFDNGVFATSMDDKWNVFMLDDFMYWVRSWTHHCIFKVQLIKQGSFVSLEKVFVTKDKTQYNSSDLQQDKILLQRLIQVHLGRDDIYVDPEFGLELIKKTISIHDPDNNSIKSIGHNDVKLTKLIHESLTSNESKDYCEVIGWTELRKNISEINDSEPLLSLYLYSRKTNSGKTFYFDKDANSLLGQIEIKSKLSSS